MFSGKLCEKFTNKFMERFYGGNYEKNSINYGECYSLKAEDGKFSSRYFKYPVQDCIRVAGPPGMYLPCVCMVRR